MRRSIPSFDMPLSTARVPLLSTRILVLMMAIFFIFWDIIIKNKFYSTSRGDLAALSFPNTVFTYRGPNTSHQTSTRCYCAQGNLTMANFERFGKRTACSHFLFSFFLNSFFLKGVCQCAGRA